MKKFMERDYETKEKWGKVNELLLGGKGNPPSSFLTDIHALLILNYEKHGFTLDEQTLINLKLRFLQNSGSDSEISNAILAICYYDPTACVRWLKCLAQSMDIGTKEKKEILDQMPQSIGSSGFFSGFILGIFRVAYWLNCGPENTYSEKEKEFFELKQKQTISFNKFFPCLIRDTIQCHHSIAVWNNRMFEVGALAKDESQFSKEFSGQLSNLIKKFTKQAKNERNRKETADLVDKRIALLEKCLLTMPIDKDDSISILRPCEILLEQLCYALFGVHKLNQKHFMLSQFLSAKNK